MRFHCLQHVPFETPGNIETWIAENRHLLSFTKFFGNDLLPLPGDFDALIIMGGYMSIHDEINFPWLKKEKELIAAAIRQKKKILGVCLGSQLIADVSGATVYPNPEKEIGFMPVHFTETAKQSPFFKDFPDEATVFHWHGETFDLPDEAIHLAYTSACRNQAYSIGNHILGLQFHFEVTPKIVRDMIEQDGHELIPASYIHSAGKIMSDLHYLDSNKKMLFQLLDEFF